MRQHLVEDVAHLPTFAFGRHSILWWGTLAFMAIEGTAFLIGLWVYFYLFSGTPGWVPGGKPPDLHFALLFTALLLISIIPNHQLKAAAEAQDLRRCRRGLVILLVIGVGLIAIRAFEYTTLNTRWDSNAYGSIVWTLLSLHTLHLATDVIDSAVLTVLVLKRRPGPRRFTDVAEDADYWYFVLAAWLPLFLVLYFVPRLI
jgi:cytochrome c oxidase subunit III